ncbi:uncharacterized protein SOCEGT47_013800 [Sorangium cellulosum]|uniref:Serpin domain-containing protein n=2 Tax=Sorangium cellulosum TaxID=56 RepID=A0A4P2PVY8_SORCE|nr:uncharacterized protein SOCEGT47_013800 [Sorangium cellulosum]
MLLLYRLLSKKLAYPVPFRPAKYGVFFRGTPVEGFDLGDEGPEEERRAMARQVLVHHSAPPDEAVLELTTTQPEDRVLIAQVEARRTLKDTASRVLSLARGEGAPLDPEDQLAIPCVDMAITRNYRELAGRKLKNAGARGFVVSEAQQDIQLRLDARGAEVKSSAHLGVACAAPPRAFYFTCPFVVLLVRRRSDEPYLVVWVQTPELLIPLAAPAGGSP